MDVSILHSLNNLFARHDGIEDPSVFYANAAEVLFLGMLILAFVLARGRARTATRRAVVAGGLSAGVALAIAQVVAQVVDRPRPFVALAGSVHLFSHHAADPGFPSDHTTAAFAIGAALLLRNRAWGTVVLVFATLLALARVGMGVHYPSDVLAGAALGTLVAVVLWHPAVRALLDRLADRSGAVLDGALRVVRPAARG
jgi:undecaprenyl-diphosphatase